MTKADGIERFYEAIVSVIDAVCRPSNFEIVCVDDGSRDDTLPKLIALTERDRRFRVVELSRNFGKEAALDRRHRYGKRRRRDTDRRRLAGPARTDRATWWRSGKRGPRSYLARRNDRSSDSFMKRTTAHLFYRYSQPRIERPDPGLTSATAGCMDRVAVEALKRLPERQRFMKGLFSWVGFKTVAIDYARDQRAAGTTKFSGWKLWNFALEGITEL